MLPINAYFHSACMVSMSSCYNICLEKEIKLLFEQSCIFGDSYHMVRSVTKKKKKKKTIEHTSLFIFDLAIRHTFVVSA